MEVKKLHNFVKKLLNLTKEMTKNGIEYNLNDNFAVMLLGFFSKQEEHMKVISLLVEYGYERDAELNARSMIEGLILIKWTYQNPKDRSFLWYYFPCILAWRRMQERINNGEKIEQKEGDLINQNINSYGEKFYIKKAREHYESKTSEPFKGDPYFKKWYGSDFAYLVQQVNGAEVLYKNFYRPFSDWHHWNPMGLWQALERDKKTNIFSYSLSSIVSLTNTLVVGFECLIQTAEVVNHYFNLRFDTKLKNLAEEIEVASRM